MVESYVIIITVSTSYFVNLNSNVFAINSKMLQGNKWSPAVVLGTKGVVPSCESQNSKGQNHFVTLKFEFVVNMNLKIRWKIHLNS